jgi:hypothetical protein
MMIGDPDMDQIQLAVNGGLMSGMRSNQAMVDAGAEFLRDDQTAKRYRLWSIDDRFPAMVQVSEGGAAIALEVWHLTASGFVAILNREPAGLSVGKVELTSCERVLGVIGEPILCEGHKEITEFGGWRAYREYIDRKSVE